jgi:carbon storage regulator CsrA
MLILGAQAGEKILIADNCSIHIVQIQGGKVRLGLDFPESIPVDRESRRALKRAIKVHRPGIAIFTRDDDDA